MNCEIKKEKQKKKKLRNNGEPLQLMHKKINKIKMHFRKQMSAKKKKEKRIKNHCTPIKYKQDLKLKKNKHKKLKNSNLVRILILLKSP